MPRLAIINHEKCKPKKCAHECKKKCPVNGQGKKCIEIEKIATVADALCIGCGICEKVCPFKAIKMVNIPEELKSELVHKYGENGFRLYRLPLIRKNCVMGILGANGIGKSTLIKLLSGNLTPNFGGDIGKDADQILKRLRSFSMTIRQYWQLMQSGQLKVVVKQQNLAESELSGGEQQLKACNDIASLNADVYIFDEPTNFLDIKQRMVVARLIQGLVKHDRYVFVIDHDISFLDYCSDTISVLYGVPGAYGVVARPGLNSETINNYVQGYLPQENMQIRDSAFNFKRRDQFEEELDLNESKQFLIPYPEIKVSYQSSNFSLTSPPGHIPGKYGITLLLGENGTGKTSFIRELATVCGIKVSFKPQFPKLQSTCTIEQLLLKNFSSSYTDAMFRSDVLKPLDLDHILHNKINTLSGGEVQRLAICCCLAQKADLYLLDEPSAMLDIEQRMQLGKILKRFLIHNKTSAIVIEHDIGVALQITRDLDSRVLVFQHDKSVSEPKPLTDGMNCFLSILDVTLRKDQTCGRYRINKHLSNKDQEQRTSNSYFTN